MKLKFALTNFTALLFVVLCQPLFSNSIESVCEDEPLWQFYCPPDRTVSCNAELWDLSIFGTAKYKTSHGWVSAGRPVVKKRMNSCGGGIITRTWTVEDHHWNVHRCTQTITVGSGNSFNYSSIQWPKDVALEGCHVDTHPSRITDGWPTWDWEECSKVGASYRDLTFTFGRKGCKKIMRTWTIMDWCQKDSWGRYKRWTHKQIIIVEGGSKPVVNCVDKVEAESYNCKNGRVKAQPLSAHTTGSCSDDISITHNSPYAYKQGADISGVYPIGETWVTYTIRYGCHGKVHCKTKVVVSDESRPHVYCIGSLAVPLMGVDNDHDGIPEDGMVEIWAKEFDRGSTASCNGGMLRYSFSEDPNDNAKTFTCADVGSNKVKMYVTDRYGRQSYCIVDVEIQNNSANIPNCQPTVQDPKDDGVTPPSDSTNNPTDTIPTDTTQLFFVSGHVVNRLGQPYPNARVFLSGDSTATKYVIRTDTVFKETSDTFLNLSGTKYWTIEVDTVLKYSVDTIVSKYNRDTLVDNNGQFAFKDLSSDITYQLRAEAGHDTLQKNTVNMLDANYLLDFLSNKVAFSSLDQYIAADVDENGKIDLEDLRILLSFLSGNKNDTLSYGWKIIDSTYFTLTPAIAFDSFDVVQSIGLDSLNPSVHKTLVAIKIGDIISQDSDQNHTVAAAAKRSISKIKSSVRVNPNPFVDVVDLNYADKSEGLITIQLIDAKGQLIKSKSIHTSVGHNRITFDLSSSDAKGLIIYRVIDEKDIYTGRIIRI